MVKYCSICGIQLKNEMKYCPVCGIKIEQQSHNTQDKNLGILSLRQNNWQNLKFYFLFLSK